MCMRADGLRTRAAAVYTVPEAAMHPLKSANDSYWKSSAALSGLYWQETVPTAKYGCQKSGFCRPSGHTNTAKTLSCPRKPY